MAIFILTPLTGDPSAINAAVERSISDPADRFRLQSDRGWLISYPGTSVELCNVIGLTGQPEGTPSIGSAIVVPISSYYGRGPSEMWEWLKTRLER
jgi:hypothetical protein